MNRRTRIAVSAAAFLAPLLAFKASIHMDITTAALSSILVVVGGQPAQFTPQAILEVAEANEDADCGGTAACICYSCQIDESRHFDNEAFEGGSERILKAREAVIAAITRRTPRDTAARRILGAALHTVQDYYAHSNWTNLNGSTVDPRLGTTIFAGLPLSAETCPSEPGTLGGAGLTEITSGYFDLPNICAYPPGKCSHGALPGCLSTGISKDEPGRPGYPAAESAAISASVAYVQGILNYAGETLPSGRSYPVVAGNATAIRALLGMSSEAGLQTGVRFERFEFVRVAGRPGHESYFRIPGDPVAGEGATGSAVLSGPVAAVSFRLVSPSGAPLSTPALATGDRNAARNEYTGAVVLPEGPFRVAATGVDQSGRRFDLTYPELFTPRSVEVAVANTTDAVAAGTRTALTYRVRNAGPAGQFELAAASAPGVTARVTPGSVRLEQGASVEFIVQVMVPAALETGSEIPLTVSAGRTGAAAERNRVGQRLEVAGN